MKKNVIFPEKISLVDHEKIMDGTVTTLNDFLTNGDAYLLPRRVNEGVTLSHGGEGFNIQERTGAGMLVNVDTFRNSRTLSFSINLSGWTLGLESLLQGMTPDTEENQNASIEATDDATVKGLVDDLGILTQKFACLFVTPKNKENNDTLYFYVPKCAVPPDEDREMQLHVAHLQPQLQMRALGLYDTEPDEVTEHQKIYSGVTPERLIFPFEGSVDAV